MKYSIKIFIYTSLSVFLFGCNTGKPDKLFYSTADILDIKRDDDSQYHLLVRYKDGITESISDVKCIVKMGNYKPVAEVPFVNWDNGNNKGTIRGYAVNSSQYSYMSIMVYLPLDYNIQLFND